MGRTTEYGYDENARLTSRSYPDPSENVSFTYTATGRRETATDARGVTRYTYDVRDRLKTQRDPAGRVLGYDYDGQGNRTKLTATIAALSLAGRPEVRRSSRRSVRRVRAGPAVRRLLR